MRLIILDICLSFELAVMYITTIFLSEIISYRFSMLGFAYMFFISIVYGFAMMSRSKKEALIKWALSLPFSYLVIQFFWRTQFAIRALNWVFPGYGKQSAGGKFAGFIEVCVLSLLCLITGVAALFVKPKKCDDNGLDKIQMIICTVVTLGIIVAVLVIEGCLPLKG